MKWLLEVVGAGVEDLVHDPAEDGVLHCSEHKPHVVGVRGDCNVGVDLGPRRANVNTSQLKLHLAQFMYK